MTLLRYIGISKIYNTCCALARVCEIEVAHMGAREAFVCVCVSACVRACVHARARVCVCLVARTRERGACVCVCLCA